MGFLNRRSRRTQRKTGLVARASGAFAFETQGDDIVAPAKQRAEQLGLSFRDANCGGVATWLLWCRALTKTDHVLDELAPEEKQAAFRILEVAVSGEPDDACGEVVIHLLAHFALDRAFDLLGVRNPELSG